MFVEDYDLFLVDLVDRADVVGIDLGIVEDCGGGVFGKNADTQVCVIEIEGSHVRQG